MHITIESRRALGDVVVLTSLAHNLQSSLPDIHISVKTTFPEVWENNPTISPLSVASKRIHPNTRRFAVTLSSGIKLHYSQAYVEASKGLLNNNNLKCFSIKPKLYLSQSETTSLVGDPYWVVIAGNKQHMTVKQWNVSRYQQVVDYLNSLKIVVVQAGVTFDKTSGLEHSHPRLSGVMDFVDKTNTREFIRLIAHASGVICPITAAMHIAAAFDVPCVTIAGGREDYCWNAYDHGNPALSAEQKRDLIVPHKLLTEIGGLECCRSGGCWRSFVDNKTTFDVTDKNVCVLPVIDQPLNVPKCMDLITVDEVITAIRWYYDNKYV